MIAMAASLAAAGLWFAPDAFRARVHATTCDALRPGWQLLHHSQQTLHSFRNALVIKEIQTLQRERDEARSASERDSEQVQRLTAQLASAHLIADVPLAHSSVSAEERLFWPALVEAAVLGETTSQAWRDGRVLDRGWKHGVRESALVLQRRAPLIDLGAAAQIAPEDSLLVGRTIIGKIVVVGRWTSTFLPVTDAEYRGRAQLVRDTDHGPVWAAQGLLCGDGNARCRLEGIPVEEAVRVGDLVYSAERDGAQPAPLAYGRVIEARSSPGDREWMLVVEPAANMNGLTTVHVLRTAFNPARFWGN